jgi:DNA-binding NtrC family response regulator
MPKLQILVIEDDPLAQKVMSLQLKEHAVDFARDAETARRALKAGRPDLCFIDLELGDGGSASGLELIPLAVSKGIYTVVMSGHSSEHVVERAYELGCNDFYSKGNEEANVGGVLNRFEKRERKSETDILFTERFVTEDPATRALILDALKYAASDLPFLVLGPSGTGKTNLARIIHDHSARTGQFVSINCAAYTEDLLEAELFGYRKGAFTGAGDSRKGKLLAADRGTLFLDEIGSMSLNMQTKLLKAIEERCFYPLGSDRAETSQFRIISATLEDLQSLIKAGKLRFDFFQRIHGLTLDLKPLARRSADIFPLISHFTRGGKRLSFTADAKERLLRYDWPGNVRELKKLVDLLSAGQEGRVALDTVDRLLSTVLREEKTGGYVTDEQYLAALKGGLDAAVDRFIDGIVARSLDDNAGKKTKVLEDLKISTRILYASLKRSGGAPDKAERP